jgi:hypothetical protein
MHFRERLGRVGHRDDRRPLHRTGLASEHDRFGGEWKALAVFGDELPENRRAPINDDRAILLVFILWLVVFDHDRAILFCVVLDDVGKCFRHRLDDGRFDGSGSRFIRRRGRGRECGLWGGLWCAHRLLEHDLPRVNRWRDGSLERGRTGRRDARRGCDHWCDDGSSGRGGRRRGRSERRSLRCRGRCRDGNRRGRRFSGSRLDRWLGGGRQQRGRFRHGFHWRRCWLWCGLRRRLGHDRRAYGI